MGEIAEAGKGEPTRVLVVDDVSDNADMLAILCRLHDFDVEVAYSARAALDAARRFSPDVVLCDIGLPDMSGYELAEAFRADPALRSCILIAVSGFGRTEDKQAAGRAGFDATSPSRLIATPCLRRSVRSSMRGHRRLGRRLRVQEGRSRGRCPPCARD